MSDESLTRFDPLLLPFVRAHGDLPSVLRSFFGWLHARSDLYVVDPDPSRAVGFAPGAAERALLAAFRAFPPLPPASLPAGPRVDVRDVGSAAQNASITGGSLKGGGGSAPPAPGGIGAPDVGVGGSVGAGTSSLRDAAPAASVVRFTDDGLQIPMNNGGVGPGYVWEQTLSDVTVLLTLPAAARASDVTCDVRARWLRVALRGAPVPVVDAALYAPVRASDAEWSVEDAVVASSTRARVDVRATRVHAPPPDCGLSDTDDAALVAGAADSVAGRLFSLVLEKVTPTWWRSLVEGGPEIDATRVDSTQPISAYDAETQAAISKLMYEQAEKRKAGPNIT